MGMDRINVAVVTMNSKQNYDEHMMAAEEYISSASQNGANWVLMPEMFPVLGDSAKIKNVAKEFSDQIFETLKSWAKKYKIVLFSGSVPEYIPGEDKCYNTTYLICNDGKLLAKYRKIHLFELNDSSGKKIISEKENYLSGESLSVCEVDGWNVGLAICYDLRFPSMFEKLAQEKDLDAIIIPAAFTEKTGQAHWELLLRARAVEQQCFVIASNQVGRHSEVMESFGHSMVIEPWGEVLVNSKKQLGAHHAVIDKKRIKEAKSKVPSRMNRHFK